MKTISKILPALLAFALLSSCSGDEKGNNANADSLKNDSSPKTTVLQTDSGKIMIDASGNAVQFDANGKIKGRGHFDGNQPSGAWLRYDENGNIISAQHFSSDGTPTKQLDKNDFEFRIWESKSIGARLTIPKNWEELSSPNPDLLASFSKKVDDDSVKIKPNINIVKAQLKPGDNLAKLAEMQMNLMHQNFPRVSPPVAEEYFTVDSCQAFRRYGMYDTPENRAGYLNAIIISGNTAWFISCEAQNKANSEFLLYQGVFHEIVDSFHRVK